MKTTTLAALMAAALMTGTGCSTLTHQERVANLADISNMAAYVGTGLHLEQAPQDAPYFEAAVKALDKFAGDGEWKPADLAEALKALPVDQLSGSKGAILIVGGVQLYDRAADRLLKLNTGGEVAAVAMAIRDGIETALLAHRRLDGAWLDPAERYQANQVKEAVERMLARIRDDDATG